MSHGYGDKIRKLRKLRGYTQQDLADALDCKKSTISMYENENREPSFEVLEAIADTFNVSMSYLLGEANTPFVARNVIPNSIIKTRRVPVIGEIAAGAPILAEQQYDEYVDVPDTGKHFDFALKVCGDSMVPMYFDGDYVLLRQQSDVDDGQIAAVVIDDTATLKHVYHNPHGVQLIAENRKYSPMFFSNEEPVHILGLAIGFLRWEE